MEGGGKPKNPKGKSQKKNIRMKQQNILLNISGIKERTYHRNKTDRTAEVGTLTSRVANADKTQAELQTNS